MPAMLPRVKLYTRDFPIFEEYGVRTEIDKALRSKVWLKSGGYIVINQTEALVAIDVNTGRYVGKKTSGRLEDTILKTNLEAVKEIVRQLRLRDMGGIVVLDFIDMEDKKNRQKVFQTLEQELRRDRAPSKAIQVSDFGLIIITRKRVKQSLERLMTDQCPYCTGTGTIKSSATVCQEILNEFRKVGNDLDGQGVLLRVNPEIAEALQGDERGVLREVEQVVGRKVTVRPDAYLHHEQFDVMSSVIIQVGRLGEGREAKVGPRGRYPQRRGGTPRPASRGACMHKVRSFMVAAAVAGLALGCRPSKPRPPVSSHRRSGSPSRPGPTVPSCRSRGRPRWTRPHMTAVAASGPASASTATAPRRGEAPGPTSSARRRSTSTARPRRPAASSGRS